MGRVTGYPSIDKPWLKYYSKEQIAYNLPKTSIYEYLYMQNKDYLNEIALIYFNSKISFTKFFHLIDEFAGALQNYGVKKGDIVSVCMPNIPEAVIAFYAINRIGAVADMIHPLASANEIKSCVSASEAKIMILIDMDFCKVKSIISETKLDKVIIASASQSMPRYLKS